MPCKHCHDYCFVQPIIRQSDVDRAVTTVRDGIAGAVLRETMKVHSDRHHHPSFEEWLEHPADEDRVEFQFRCEYCADRFHLLVQYKPRLSGEWAPVHA